MKIQAKECHGEKESHRVKFDFSLWLSQKSLRPSVGLYLKKPIKSYLITPIAFPILVKAAMALSSICLS
jgi:hypothetical protein